MPAINPLPTPPSRNDPANFSDRADAFLAALPAYTSEANALLDDVHTSRDTVQTLRNEVIAAGLESAAANAATAATKAAEAASSASEAFGYLQTYRATSYGALANDPVVDPNGNPPTVGDEYFNTSMNLLKRFNGVTWQASDIATANLAATGGSALVGADDGAGGSLWTTVAGFLSYLKSTAGAAIIGFIQAGVGAVLRSVQDKLRESVSILDFIPPDEHAAIRAETSTYDCKPAFDAATAAHDCIDVPEGAFKVSGSVGWTGRDNVSLRGKGKKSKIIRTTTGPVVQLTSCSRPTVAGIWAEGNYTYAAAGAGIGMTSCTDILVSGNYTTRSSRQGINAESCLGGSVVGNFAFDNWQDGIMVRSDSRNITVAGNVCRDNGDSTFASPVGEGIHLFNAIDCVVTGNICHSNTDHGVALEGAENCNITGNSLTQNAVSGISINTAETYNGSGNAIIGNTIRGNASDGIVLNGVDDNQIVSNVIRGNGGYGINQGVGSGTSQDRITASRNHIIDNALGGIFHNWNNVDCVISDNLIRGAAGRGILINRAQSLDTVITGNSVKGFPLGQIQDNGTTSRIRGNDCGNKLSGRVTLAAGTATVTFAVAEPAGNFLVVTEVGVNETIRVTGKTTTGFTLTSSNAASTAQVQWAIVDSRTV